RHVLPGMGAVCVAGDRDNRDAAVQRLDKAGHEVGRAGAQGAVADAGAVRNSGIGIGRKGATALVIDQEMPQAEAGERVVERQELKAAHAEHRPGAREAQHLGERAAAIHAALWAVAGGGIGGGGHRFVSLAKARPRRPPCEPVSTIASWCSDATSEAESSAQTGGGSGISRNTLSSAGGGAARAGSADCKAAAALRQDIPARQLSASASPFAWLMTPRASMSAPSPMRAVSWPIVAAGMPSSCR